MKTYSFTILRPGGNDTCLVNGLIDNPSLRKRINDNIMARYQNVEQVGFIGTDKNNPQLCMAGGEFCGNATRSAAWMYLDGVTGKILIQVSGVNKVLNAGVEQNGNTFSQMPVYKNPTYIQQDRDNPNNFTVSMQGITHYIVLEPNTTKNISDNELKQNAFTLLTKNQYTSLPASGVMYCSRKNNSWNIKPVVYVRDINTLFLETSCGSGTIAFGLVQAYINKSSIRSLDVIQPSGMSLYATINYSNNRFTYAAITGPIQILEKSIITL